MLVDIISLPFHTHQITSLVIFTIAFKWYFDNRRTIDHCQRINVKKRLSEFAEISHKI